MSATSTVALRWLLLAMIVVGVIGMRWITLGWFSVETPFYDQWDGEILALYKPALDDALTWQMLLAPHNEHQILVTRLFNLALFTLNESQFDNTVAAFGNAVVYAFALAMLALPILKQLEGAALLLGALLFAVVGVLPYGWENMVSGFQNGFYFLNGISIAAIALLALHKPTTGNFFSAIALCFLSMMTLGSGVLLVPVAALVIALRWRAAETTGRQTLVAGAVIAATAVIGIATLRSVLGHRPLQTQSFGDFIDALTTVAAWPLPAGTPGFLLVWWPSALMLTRLWKQRDNVDQTGARFDVFLLGVAAWVLVQAAAIAYSRGHGLIYTPSRYYDLLVLGPICNIMLAVRLIGTVHSTAVRTVTTYVTTLVGSALLATLWVYSIDGIAQFRLRCAQQAQQRETLRQFLAGAGTAAFEGKSPAQTSYPSAARLASILNDPTVRALLPVSIRSTPAQPGRLTRAIQRFRAQIPRTPP